VVKGDWFKDKQKSRYNGMDGLVNMAIGLSTFFWEVGVGPFFWECQMTKIKVKLNIFFVFTYNFFFPYFGGPWPWVACHTSRPKLMGINVICNNPLLYHYSST
jgi:hypothetical protein